MSVDLHAAASDYLKDRRARGYLLADAGWLLESFLEDLAASGESVITTDAALAFATKNPRASRGWQARKLRLVRGLAMHVHGIDPAAAQSIPPGLIPSKTPRRIPYLYSPEHIVALMDRALTLKPRMFALSIRTLIGLVAVTGMRSGEAGALNLEDLNSDRGTLTVRGKNRRVRELPLHPSTIEALHGYIEARNQVVPPTPQGPLLISACGFRLHMTTAQAAFRTLVNECKLPLTPGSRPARLHDARHSFAVSSLIDAHRQGVDIDARIATLANYLGHADPSNTYYYLTASPQLMQTVADRMIARQEQLR